MIRREEMQIPVNKNIDEYKDDFFKGLTFRQTIVMAGVFLTAGAGFLSSTVMLHIPSSLAVYFAFPPAFLVGAAGIMRVHGMTLMEWRKKKKQVAVRPYLTYSPCLTETPEVMEKAGPGRKVRKEAVYLETMEEQSARVRDPEGEAAMCDLNRKTGGGMG